MKTIILYSLVLTLCVSCNHRPQGKFQGYKETNDTATPVSQFGRIPYQSRR
jgi:hypothetical protein